LRLASKKDLYRSRGRKSNKNLDNYHLITGKTDIDANGRLESFDDDIFNVGLFC